MIPLPKSVAKCLPKNKIVQKYQRRTQSIMDEKPVMVPHELPRTPEHAADGVEQQISNNALHGFSRKDTKSVERGRETEDNADILLISHVQIVPRAEEESSVNNVHRHTKSGTRVEPASRAEEELRVHIVHGQTQSGICSSNSRSLGSESCRAIKGQLYAINRGTKGDQSIQPKPVGVCTLTSSNSPNYRYQRNPLVPVSPNPSTHPSARIRSAVQKQNALLSPESLT